MAVKVMGGGCKSHPQMFVSAYGVCVCVCVFCLAGMCARQA